MVGCVNGDTCKLALKFMALSRPVVFLWLINRPLILILILIPGNYYLAVLLRATSAVITKALVRYLMGEKGSIRVRGPLIYQSNVLRHMFYYLGYYDTFRCQNRPESPWR